MRYELRITHYALDLPSPDRKHLLSRQGGEVDAYHWLAQVAAGFGQDGGVVVVGYGLHYGAGAAGRVARFEYAGAYEHPVRSEGHHEGGVGGRGLSPGRAVDHGPL